MYPAPTPKIFSLLISESVSSPSIFPSPLSSLSLSLRLFPRKYFSNYSFKYIFNPLLSLPSWSILLWYKCRYTRCCPRGPLKQWSPTFFSLGIGASLRIECLMIWGETEGAMLLAPGGLCLLVSLSEPSTLCRSLSPGVVIFLSGHEHACIYVFLGLFLNPSLGVF